ncbi:MAG: hypothetical protein A2Z25_23445, partial [Planctomycetes bacterium RBG_16_55_9]
MRVRFEHQAVVGIVLICQLSICLGKEAPGPTDPNRYVNAVREFADNVLLYGRDTYGPKHTPLFVDGVNIHTHEPVQWIAPNGDRWILSNLASQQNLFRTLDALTTITGDPKYKQAAVDAIRYAFENLRTPNGLLYWGGHSAYDARADKPCGRGIHEFKGTYPYYELMWEVDPEATKHFIEAFWSGHISDWSNLDMDRHCYNLNGPLNKPWGYEYKGGPVFFESKGLSAYNTASDLSYAAVWLTEFTGDREPLRWAELLAHRYVETRDPQVGISFPAFTRGRRPKIQFPSRDGIIEKLGPIPYIFPAQYIANTELWKCCFGYNTFTPERVVNGQFLSSICQLQLGEMLGDDGRKLTQWAIEELTAYMKVAYREEQNAFVPMSLGGMDLIGYVSKEDGPLGFKGTKLEPVPAGPIELWAYISAYCSTKNKSMWDMARNIARGNNYGDIGVNEVDEPLLNFQTESSDPYALTAFNTLYNNTGKKQFLALAQKIGDNIVLYRFSKGFFEPGNQHAFAKFDSIDPLVLLHLYSVFIGDKNVGLPGVWPGMSYFETEYRGKDLVVDNQIIYVLKGLPEPPVSLQEAAAVGNLDLIKSFVEAEIKVDAREDSFFKTAVHRAVISGHRDVVEFLLSRGADIDARDSFLVSALHYAVQNNHKDIAELLLANGASADARDGAGDTPLHYAARFSKVGKDLPGLLISKGADANAKNSQGQTPLDVAVSNNHKDIAELLLANGSQISTINAVAYLGDVGKVREFLEQGIDINARDDAGNASLHSAVDGGHKDIAEFLLDHGADV